MKTEHAHLVKNLNVERKEIYESVIDSVQKNVGGFYFVYGGGGCGKTYLWNTIIIRLRSEKKIVLPIVSSSIVATLFPGGRTSHSRFKIPLKLNEDSSCSISHNSDIIELLKQTNLIILDEAPMQNRLAFECLDRSLRDIIKSVNHERYQKPFGGITLLLGGDFHHILPVITKGSKVEIVSACILRSPLWSACSLYILINNMRLRRGTSDEAIHRVEHFGKWVLDVGDGKIPHANPTQSDDIFRTIKILEEFCIQSDNCDVNLLIDAVFLNLPSRYTDIGYLRQHAILTPMNKVVDHVNNIILEINLGESFSYLNNDSIQCQEGCHENLTSVFPVEYLNSIKLPGMSVHNLILKEGVVVMLSWNLNQTIGLCNGTRMVVKKCYKHTVVCEIIFGNHSGTTHLIPRIQHAILTPMNKVVDHVNNIILEINLGESFSYLNNDSIQCQEGCHENLTSVFLVEYLNSIKLPGMSVHNLILKEGVVVMLSWNLNQTIGLCNGTRMVVKKCYKHTVVCEIIFGNHSGTTHLIPRIELCPDTNLSFNLVRLQFSLQVCFVMTINKSHGQSLDRIGLYLPDFVFYHGQLYVVISCVTSPDGLIVFIETPECGTSCFTSNVVYEEVFYDLINI